VKQLVGKAHGSDQLFFGFGRFAFPAQFVVEVYLKKFDARIDNLVSTGWVNAVRDSRTIRKLDGLRKFHFVSLGQEAFGFFHAVICSDAIFVEHVSEVGPGFCWGLVLHVLFQFLFVFFEHGREWVSGVFGV